METKREQDTYRGEALSRHGSGAVRAKRRHSPWIWIPSLSAAEEIPSAMVTFVSILMFVQFGVSDTVTTLYAGLLFLPNVFASFIRKKVRKAGNFRRNIYIAQVAIFAALTFMALYLNYSATRSLHLFLCLFVVAALCAWHTLLARMYYERMLLPRQQKLFSRTRAFASQTAVILTYGVLIIIVGFLEIFFRDISKAWAMESYLVAGVFFFFLIQNLVVLDKPFFHDNFRKESVKEAVRAEIQVISRIRRKPHVVYVLICLFFLLLPQALLFNTRVFFLLASSEEGGLACSVQDVGFAQGTIGVIAFTVGLFLGRMLIKRHGAKRLFWLMAVPLTLSPLSYLVMSLHPVTGNLLAICCMTFFAQFCFGFGLNSSSVFIRFVSNDRYKYISNFLNTPLVASMLFMPMMLSGWLETILGFKCFFLFTVACAPLSWMLMALGKVRTKLG